MEKQLALDTSTSRPTVALLDGETLVEEWMGPSGPFHGETLLLGIDTLLKQNKWTLGHLDFISLGIGPGTFTGLRIGVISAKFLADTQNIPIAPASSLHAQALNALDFSHDARRVWSISDAKRKEVYAYACPIKELSPQTPEKEEFSQTPQALAQIMEQGDLLIGEGTLNYKNAWPKYAQHAPLEHLFLRAKHIGLVGREKIRHNGGLPAVEIMAKYMKTEKF